MFLGREKELESLRLLLQKPTSSLVACRGRRRIGKSTLFREFARRNRTEFIVIEGPNSKGIHDVYEIEDHPFRKPIMITKASDRIGKPYVEVDVDRIVGIIECDIPDEARAFKDPDPITTQIGQNVADFLVQNMREGKIPPTFLNLQSGVGSGANAVLGPRA